MAALGRVAAVGTALGMQGGAGGAPAAGDGRAVYDLVITGGRVIDPASGLDGVMDVAVTGGMIAAVGPSLLSDGAAAAELFDARGMVVMPGLVDAHCHIYNLCTPLGEPVDEVCLGRGVTTAVDAGSAGATTFNGFRKFIAEPSKTRALCMLNVSMHGLASAGSTGGGASRGR